MTWSLLIVGIVTGIVTYVVDLMLWTRILPRFGCQSCGH